MAQAREKDGRVVFIGNIPYGVSEEQICELFARCGPVVSFRLVYDKETGRPKGFGFLEYTTADSAAAATRNLNDFDIGGRKLRVAYSNDNDKGSKPADGALALPVPGSGVADISSLPPLPPGVEIAPGVQAPDAISKTLSAIPLPQLLDILSQMKALVTSDPQKATALLQQAPQLSFALFQAMLSLGLVDTSILSSLVATTQTAAPPPAAPQPAVHLPPQQAMPTPFPAPGHMPPGYPPQQYAQPGFPVPPSQSYATPPPAPQYQPPPQPGFAMPPGMTPEIIKTVSELSRDQIMALDENARNEIFKIRMALGLQPMPA